MRHTPKLETDPVPAPAGATALDPVAMLVALRGGRAARSSRGDAQLGDLIRQHGAAVARVAAVFQSNPADRQDLVQQIWLAAWRAWPDFRGECSPRTFLLRIAHNRAVNALCRRKAFVVGLEEAAQVADPAPDPERHVAARQDTQRLLDGLHRLNVVQRQVLSLSLEGIPQDEIGEILGIRTSNVAVTLHRARSRLRAWLENSK